MTREPGSSKVLEAAVQKKVADLRKYWLNMPRDGSAGLDEYQSGQRKFGDVMSTAFQWLDCIEGEAARPTNAAELQDLQRQTKLFRVSFCIIGIVGFHYHFHLERIFMIFILRVNLIFENLLSVDVQCQVTSACLFQLATGRFRVAYPPYPGL